MSTDQVPAEPLLWKEEFLKLLASIEREYYKTTSESKQDMILRYQTLIAVGGYIGPRAKEFLHITWNDIVDKSEGDLYQFKVGRKRKVYFNEGLIQIVNKNYKKLDPINPHHLILHKKESPVVPIKTQQFNQNFRRFLERAGIKARQPSSHTLRKTFGMHIYRDVNNCSDEGLHLACKMLDHWSIEETLKYLGITDKRIKETYKKL